MSGFKVIRAHETPNWPLAGIRLPFVIRFILLGLGIIFVMFYEALKGRVLMQQNLPQIRFTQVNSFWIKILFMGSSIYSSNINKILNEINY